MITTGSTSSASVRPAESTVRPLAVVGSLTPSADPLVIPSNARTKIARPRIP